MRRLDGFILGLLIAALLAGLAVVSWVTISSAERVLLPQLDRKAEAAAKSVASLVRQGLADGLTLDNLYGVDSVLVAAVSEAREFAFAALSTADGRLIEAAARDPAGVAPLRPLPQGPPADLLTSRAPVVVDGVEVAGVLVGVPPSVVEEAVRRLWLDIAVVLLVSALVALELLSFVQGLPMGASFRGVAERLEALRRGDLRRHPPLAEDGRFGAVAERIDGSLETVNSRQEALVRTATLRQDPEALGALAALERRFALGRARPSLGPAALVRAPLFLFYFAEELTRPFLPNFIAGLSSPIAGLSAELVISLPIVLFMAIVALSQPVLGGLTERIGRGRAFRAGAAAGVVGFVGTAYAQDLVELLIFRSCTAIGYAGTFVAAQGFIIDRTGDINRARGLALLVTAIMVAALCGPPIGGLLADRLDVRSTFLVSAGFAAAALACAWATLPADPARPGARLRGLGLAAAPRLLSRPMLAALLLGCALPAKLMLAAVCFFLVPLALAEGGFDQAAIGRVQMLYALAMLALATQAARVADGWRARPLFVGVGGLVAGSAFVHLLLWPPPWGAALLVLQLGLGQALSIAAQSSLVGQLGRQHLPELSETTLYGLFRLIERTGNAIGPAVAAVLLARYGFGVAMAAVSGIVFVGSLVFLVISGGLGAVPLAAGSRGSDR